MDASRRGDAAAATRIVRGRRYLPANELSDAEAKARYLGVRREGGTGPGWAEDKVLSGSDAALVAEAEFTRRIRDGFEAGSDDPLNKFLDKSAPASGIRAEARRRRHVP